jgi:hypothetical protein
MRAGGDRSDFKCDKATRLRYASSPVSVGGGAPDIGPLERPGLGSSLSRRKAGGEWSLVLDDIASLCANASSPLKFRLTRTGWVSTAGGITLSFLYEGSSSVRDP